MLTHSSRHLPYIPSGIAHRLRIGYPRIKTVARAACITRMFIGKICYVYNGRYYRRIEIRKRMSGYKLGEFAQTKKFCIFRSKKKGRGKAFRK